MRLSVSWTCAHGGEDELQHLSAWCSTSYHVWERIFLAETNKFVLHSWKIYSCLRDLQTGYV